MKEYNEYKEFEDYWTDGKEIIFKPDFSHELDDNYYDIIKKHEEIYFTNYNNLLYTLKKKI